uniref:Uncharacterized protein n=1 Tax=Ciona savignyi TaxID=51511 RepID=H2YSK2_CIOSA
VTHRPEVIDDFVRNFLLRMGMKRTLETFQTEWWVVGNPHVGEPSCVVGNPHATHPTNPHPPQVRDAAEGATWGGRYRDQTYVQLQKGRDFHRVNHKRVVQEKNRLITDIKRLKKHYTSYEPTLRLLKQKYEIAMKEKMLTKLERDRAVGQREGGGAPSSGGISGGADTICAPRGEDGEGGKCVLSPLLTPIPPGQRVPVRHPGQPIPHPREGPPHTSHPNWGFPPNGVNQRGFVGDLGCLLLILRNNSLPPPSVSLHPRKQIAVTTSDDHLWKMWVPSGDIIMTGEGHTDWVSDSDFHPGGAQLATSSGDSCVKIWDFSQASCVLTLSDHTHAVWGVTWHSCGDFLASCSMDNTSKIWDVHSERCRSTLRGHADSVNSIQFLHFANTLLTSSADKTLSLWDARTGLCAQTFYGHMHSVNHAVFNLKGDTIASCDSYGTVKFWDVRHVAPMITVDVGPHPANRVAFDPSGHLLAVASNDGTIKTVEIGTSDVTMLAGHDDAVQAVTFDLGGQFMLSGGSDGTLRVWS